MVVHLGRLKLVVRRIKGQCRYKNCPHDNIVLPGDKVFLLTKMGSLPNRPQAIFYKAFHKDCFLGWANWIWENQTPERDGRPAMDLKPEDKQRRAKLVRERARITRSLRRATADNLESKVERIAELDTLIAATGFPVIRYAGRRSKVVVDFGKFLKEVKDKYGSEMRVPKSVWTEAEEMGMVIRFEMEMNKWRQEEQNVSHIPHYEDSEEDK